MRTGWLVGAGVEHRLTNTIYVFADYSYSNFGKKHAGVHYSHIGVFHSAFEQDLHQLRVGVNFRF